MILRDDSFAIFANYLKAASGMTLRRDQDYLLKARLSSLLELHRCATLDDLAVLMAAQHPPRLLQHVAEAMATHETSFFRDASLFANVKEHLLPQAIERNRPAKHLRIWSAGCATGQEPYSIAMLLDEFPELHDWRIDIVATDFSADVLRRAEAGLYSHYEAQRGLPIRLLMRYFTQEDHAWRVQPFLRAKVAFSHVNLLDDFAALGQFDLVFCRNVLMYVDHTLRRDILSRLYDAVIPGGFLILGSVETFIDNDMPGTPLWETRHGPGLFQRSL